jgi:excisionase family DNA binding protein
MKEQVVTKTWGICNPQRQAKDPPRKRLLTVPESAAYLGRSINSVRELIWAGNLPCIKVGRRVHLDLFDLDFFIEQHKTQYTY